MKIGFLGAGNMSEALIRGLRKAKLISPQNIYASDVRAERLTWMKRKFGIRTSVNNFTIVKSALTLVVAVKPQNMATLGQEIRSTLTEKHLLVSIAAGFNTKRLREVFGERPRLIRVMPNTPALVGFGASVIFASTTAKKTDVNLVKKLFTAVGTVHLVQNEEDLHTITALSGSGPAYVFYFLEALVAAGVAQGLDEKLAFDLALQTLLGSAKLVLETRETLMALREKVTSPGGTTEAAIQVFEELALKDLIKKAISKAHQRSRNLANEGGDKQ